MLKPGESIKKVGFRKPDVYKRQVFVSSHLEQLYVFTPASVQDGSFVTVPSSQSCSSAAIVSVLVPPHTGQLYVFTPASVQDGSFVTLPSSHAWASKYSLSQMEHTFLCWLSSTFVIAVSYTHLLTVMPDICGFLRGLPTFPSFLCLPALRYRRRRRQAARKLL